MQLAETGGDTGRTVAPSTRLLSLSIRCCFAPLSSSSIMEDAHPYCAAEQCFVHAYCTQCTQCNKVSEHSNDTAAASTATTAQPLTFESVGAVLLWWPAVLQ